MIIDFHTHVFPDRIAASTVSALEAASGNRPYSDGTADGLLAALDAAGASVAVNLPVLTKPTQFESILGFARDLNGREYGGTRIVSFAGIHPADPNPEEHLSMVKAAGIKGIKIHPDYQRTFFDDEAYVRIIAEAKRLGLIVVTHAGVDAGFRGEEVKCTPERVLRLLDRVGGYSGLVLAHLGGAEMTREVIDSLAGEDVYFDTAYNLGHVTPSELSELLEKHGTERILFATDSPWQDISREVERIRTLGLSERELSMILSENAVRLLGIAE